MDPIERAAELFAVLSHAGRLRVLALLEQRCDLTVGELQEELGIERTALSHQLRILRDAALVRVTPEGKHKRYALADHHVAHIVRDAVAHVAEEGAR
ncbi:MAG: helix-turn-helix transcriptional regulator [Myxococcales bacterium]|nr:helix-turn-helix transcriptional regulator [Myxococcales bacterium]